MRSALTNHRPEYLMEGAGAGLCMISACVTTVLMEHPQSPKRAAVAEALMRRSLVDLAMGLTVAGLVYSPAFPTRTLTRLWIYFTAPLLGVPTGAELYRARAFSPHGVACAKLHHQNGYRCIFCGGQKAMPQ